MERLRRTGAMRWWLAIGVLCGLPSCSSEPPAPAPMDEAPAAEARPEPAALPAVEEAPESIWKQSDDLVQFAVIPVQPTDAVWVPSRDRLLVTVSGGAGSRGLGVGDSVLFVDPWSGNLGPEIPVGSRPVSIALSADEVYAYVALKGEPRVVRVDLERELVDLEIDLVSEEREQGLFARQLFPLAQDSVSFVVLASDGSMGLAREIRYYRDGDLQARLVAPFYWEYLCPAAEADTFYALGPQNAVSTVTLDNGDLLVRETREIEGIGRYKGPCLGDRMYGANGVVDLETGEVMAPLESVGQVWRAEPYSRVIVGISGGQFHAWDGATQQLIYEVSLPRRLSNGTRGVTIWGDDGIALVQDDRLILLRAEGVQWSPP